MDPSEVDRDALDLELDGLDEVVEGRLRTAPNAGDRVGKRRREEDGEGGGDGELEVDTGDGPAHASKKPKAQTATHLTTKRPTLLHACNVEVDILRSILGYLRSRFDYLHRGFTCKQLYNTIVQTPLHHAWFTQYMNKGWFSTFDSELRVEEDHPIRSMSIWGSRAVGCNFRNVRTVADFFIMDNHYDPDYVWEDYLGGLCCREQCMQRLKICPPSTFELIVHVWREFEYEVDDYGPLSEFCEWQGEGGGFCFDITMKTPSNLFAVGDQLKLMRLSFEPPLMYGDVFPPTRFIKGLDVRRRGVTGTIWWKLTCPDGRHFIDCFPFRNLFTFENFDRFPRTVFKDCTVNVDLEESWTQLPVKVGQITWIEDDDHPAGRLDVLGGPVLKAKVHHIYIPVEMGLGAGFVR
ncbi:hypothetical protein HK104_007115, partial [Borealophlyctis nickersoniae]